MYVHQQQKDIEHQLYRLTVCHQVRCKYKDKELSSRKVLASL